MLHYFRNNFVEALRTPPFRAPLTAWALVPVFLIIALVLGFSTHLLKIQILDSAIAALLPFTLFIFPSFLEEAFFRGILIPRNVLNHGAGKAVCAVIISTLAFVAWHPLNAWAFNNSAIPLFFDPWFLLIVAALGLTCGYGYVVSRSLWVPVIIHWATVLVWVLFLGGRNLLLPPTL